MIRYLSFNYAQLYWCKFDVHFIDAFKLILEIIIQNFKLCKLQEIKPPAKPQQCTLNTNISRKYI